MTHLFGSMVDSVDVVKIISGPIIGFLIFISSIFFFLIKGVDAFFFVVAQSKLR